jgi:hypothetical protein
VTFTLVYLQPNIIFECIVHKIFEFSTCETSALYFGTKVPKIHLRENESLIILPQF